MRILHTSDWHLGKSLDNISRIDEQKQFVDELCGIARQESIDIVLVAGDVFDTYNPSSQAEELFYLAVDRLSDKGERAVVVIAGNHDNPERLCAANPLALRNGIILLGYPKSDARLFTTESKNVMIPAAGPGWLELCVAGCEHNAILITLPYPSETRLEEVLCMDPDEESIKQAYSEKVGKILKNLGRNFRDDTVNLAVSHIFVGGGKESESERTIQVGGAMTVEPSALPSNAHFTALGHLHRPQEVKGAPCPAYYSGSPLAYSFSEAEHCKMVYVIDAIPGRAAQVKEIPLNCGKPLRRWVARNGIEEALLWCEDGRDSNAWIDLEVYTDRVLLPEEQKKLRDLNPGIINIRPVIKAENSVDFEYENRENRKIDKLFKDYFKFRTGTEISDELMDVFIEALNESGEYDIGGEDDATEVS